MTTQTMSNPTTAAVPIVRPKTATTPRALSATAGAALTVGAVAAAVVVGLVVLRGLPADTRYVIVFALLGLLVVVGGAGVIAGRLK